MQWHGRPRTSLPPPLRARERGKRPKREKVLKVAPLALAVNVWAVGLQLAEYRAQRQSHFPGRLRPTSCPRPCAKPPANWKAGLPLQTLSEASPDGQGRGRRVGLRKKPEFGEAAFGARPVGHGRSLLRAAVRFAGPSVFFLLALFRLTVQSQPRRPDASIVTAEPPDSRNNICRRSFLANVGRIVGGYPALPTPTVNGRPIKLHEPLPGVRFAGLHPPQEAGRRGARLRRSVPFGGVAIVQDLVISCGRE